MIIREQVYEFHLVQSRAEIMDVTIIELLVFHF